MKKIILFLLILLCNTSIRGQIYVKNSEQNFIEKVASKGIVLIKSDYVIEDKTTKQQFGLNGNKIFGTVYSIGYLTEKGIVTATDIHSVVSRDPKFEKYKDGYNPVLSSSVWNLYKDSISNVLIPDSSCVRNSNEIIVYNLDKDSLNNNGFSLKANDENGWIVWISIDENSELNNSSELLFSSYHFTKKEEKSESVSCPQTNRKVLGGFLISPNYTVIGKISFSINGILKNVNKEWMIESIICDTTQSNCTNDDSPSELTPITSAPTVKDKNSKKKKK